MDLTQPLVSSPENSADILSADDVNALKQSFPKVAMQWSIDFFQAELVTSIDREVELCYWPKIPERLREFYRQVRSFYFAQRQSLRALVTMKVLQASQEKNPRQSRYHIQISAFDGAD